jgi:hypothetical protein
MHAHAYANAMQLWTKHLRCYKGHVAAGDGSLRRFCYRLVLGGDSAAQAARPS